MNFQFGIDVLLKDTKLLAHLKTKRVSLLAHPASVTGDLTHTMDALFHSGIKLVSAFGPQHGIYGEKQYNMLETPDLLDQKFKIPVFSLYGEVRRPTPEAMQTFDILLIDLQDVGTRIYTYLTTLFYVLEEAVRHKKEIWVLDRPNPAGRPIEGSLLRPGFKSFVGCAENLPMRHGLTLGEFAHYFKKTFQMSLELKVIQMKDYFPEKAPGYGWPEKSWVNPSPNAPNLTMARCYPGTVLLEGTHLSEGRGTTRPLEIVGAPDIDAEKIIAKMFSLQAAWLKGCKLRSCFFEPTFYKYKEKTCSGMQIHVDDPTYYEHENFKAYRVMALWFKALRELYPDYQIWRDFHYEYEKDRLAIDIINGSDELRKWVDDSAASPADLEKVLAQDERHWLKVRAEYLIYSR
jgi:uncharacterized protein YbbC (DUF1343 family)